MFPLLRPILHRGGAGRSATRQETVDAVNPLVQRHAELLATYDAALLRLGNRQAAASLEPAMGRLRTELGKLRETVLASGGTPPTSVGVRGAALGDTDGDVLRGLEEAERGYRQALRDTLAYPHHQIRTVAILENNATGIEERLGLLRPLVDRAPSNRRAALAAAPADEATGAPADLPRTEHHADRDEQPMIERRDR